MCESIKIFLMLVVHLRLPSSVWTICQGQRGQLSSLYQPSDKLPSDKILAAAVVARGHHHSHSWNRETARHHLAQESQEWTPVLSLVLKVLFPIKRETWNMRSSRNRRESLQKVSEQQDQRAAWFASWIFHSLGWHNNTGACEYFFWVFQ